MEAAYEEVYEVHLPSIKIGSADKPTLIVFSAIPGSGKSELTKRLVNNHGFSSITNKDIRKSLEQTKHVNDVVIGDYTLWLLDRLAKQRPMTIVFDRNIDQWYEPAKHWALQNNYKFLLVRIEVSRSNLEKRLRKREGNGASEALEVLDFYQNQHNKMAQTIEANITLKDDYDLGEAASLIADIAV